MPAISTRDDTSIFYKDWGSGQPVVFSHGWPLNSDAWDDQLNLVAENGFRAIAHDRRGHGRSSQTWAGHDMDTYADDLKALFDALDLRDAVLVGHSTGGGEITRFLGRHGTSNIDKVVLLGAVPPLLVKTDANPQGIPLEVFDGIRAGILADISQYWRDFAVPFYGANREGSTVSQGILDACWLMSMQAGLRPAVACVKAFSETDFHDDLARIDVPTWVAHGEDDQIVPIDITARRSAELIKDATLTVYPGAPHGLFGSYRDAFHADLLAFLAR